MASRKSSKPATSTVHVLHRDGKKASAALDVALSGKPEVTFALAWSPEKKSPVDITSVKAGNDEKVPETGVLDFDSPYRISLGAFASGTSVKVSWSVQAFNDLNGIRAFARADNDTAWRILGTKTGLAAQETWDASADYKVP